jgi:hypothetical protein
VAWVASKDKQAAGGERWGEERGAGDGDYAAVRDESGLSDGEARGRGEPRRLDSVRIVS